MRQEFHCNRDREAMVVLAIDSMEIRFRVGKLADRISGDLTTGAGSGTMMFVGKLADHAKGLLDASDYVVSSER